MQRITKGLDLPIAGAPEQQILSGPKISRIGLMGVDYIGMKPSMLVQQGDRVKAGQALFSDKKSSGVMYTSPVSGTVAAINRGDQRLFQSIEIEVSGDDAVEFPHWRRTVSVQFLGTARKDHCRQRIVDQLSNSTVQQGPRNRHRSSVNLRHSSRYEPAGRRSGDRDSRA